MTQPRIERLRDWMAERNITYRAIGERIGVSTQGVRQLLVCETIPVKRHNALCALGFPEDLLPQPCDLPTGPRPRGPRFPGLVENHQEASHA